MTILHAIILGIVEGITEFLPISSTFHLILTSQILGFAQTEFMKLFEVFIQSGAILAAVILYKDILFKEKELTRKIILSFIPTALVGFVFYKIIKDIFFENLVLQISVFIVVGLVFIIFEKTRYTKDLNKSLATLNYSQAFIIGLIQALAIVPGVSRAGAVILGLMIFGVNRRQAATYSFLLAIPTLFAASLLDLTKSRSLLFSHDNSVSLLAVGFGASFLSALVVIRWFVQYLHKNNLSNFGWYRLIAGLVFLFWLL